MSKIATAYVAHGGQTAADRVLEAACEMAGHSMESFDAIDTARRFVRANIRKAAAEIEWMESKTVETLCDPIPEYGSMA